MKRTILLILVVIASLLGNAQDTVLNFRVTNGKIYWEKVYSTVQSQEFCKAGLERKEIFMDPKLDSQHLTGNLKETDINFNGLPDFRRPMKLAQSRVIGHAVIEFSNKEYHVLLTDIVYIQMFDWRLRHKGSHAKMEWYALDTKQHFYKAFKKLDAKILNHTFEKLFSYESN